MNLLTSEPGTSCQTVKFAIRQKWQAGYKVWMETIFCSQSECEAVSMYEYFTKKWPTEHFELTRIEHKESCLQAQSGDDEC